MPPGFATSERASIARASRVQETLSIRLSELLAEKVISEAEGYALKRVNEAEGDAARFIALFTEYQKAPQVTRRRIYLETLQEVMPTLKSKIVIDEEAKGILPLLQLNPEGAQK